MNILRFIKRNKIYILTILFFLCVILLTMENYLDENIIKYLSGVVIILKVYYGYQFLMNRI